LCSGLQVIYVGVIRPQRHWAHPLHHHAGFHELVAVVSGAAEVVLDGQRLQLGAGDVAHYPPGLAHDERAIGDQLFELLYIGFAGPELVASGLPVHDRQGRMRSLLRWLLDVPADDPRQPALAAALLLEREHCAQAPNDDLELQVRRYLREHLAEAVDVDAMAASVGLSRWHFTRRFSATVGIPPARYLERMRVEAATALLQATQLPLKAIATEVGLRDPYHLSRVVKRVTGRAPGALRSKLHEQFAHASGGMHPSLLPKHHFHRRTT
jgi:AraC-like DNA-binding protein